MGILIEDVCIYHGADSDEQRVAKSLGGEDETLFLIYTLFNVGSLLT